METTISKQDNAGNRDSSPGQPVKLNYTQVKMAAQMLRAINHKMRQNMLKLIEERKRMHVTEIYVKLRLEQSVASQNLAILRRSNLVTTEREGKLIYYSLNTARMEQVVAFINKMRHDPTVEN